MKLSFYRVFFFNLAHLQISWTFYVKENIHVSSCWHERARKLKHQAKQPPSFQLNIHFKHNFALCKI